VTLIDPTCTPIPGTPVTFTVTQGAGALGPQPVLTDTNGQAVTTFVPDPMTPIDAEITATAPGATTTTLSVTWRGLEVSTSGLAHTVRVRHSAGFSPFTLAVDTPIPSPFLATGSGPVWTSLGTTPSFFPLLDGLGLFGTPNAMATTRSDGVFSTVFTVPPLGVQILLQAYADDPTLSAPSRYMISNPVIVNL
jgi:hypothetical protein